MKEIFCVPIRQLAHKIKINFCQKILSSWAMSLSFIYFISVRGFSTLKKHLRTQNLFWYLSHHNKIIFFGQLYILLSD